jgi:hypothetical protein
VHKGTLDRSTPRLEDDDQDLIHDGKKKMHLPGEKREKLKKFFKRN